MAKKLVRKVKKVKRKYKKSKTLKQKQKQSQKQTVIVNITKTKEVKKRRKAGKKSLPQTSQQGLSQQGLTTMILQPQQGVNTSEIKLLADALRETKPLGRVLGSEGVKPISIGRDLRTMDLTDDYVSVSELGESRSSELTQNTIRLDNELQSEGAGSERAGSERAGSESVFEGQIIPAQPQEEFIESREDPRSGIRFMGQTPRQPRQPRQPGQARRYGLGPVRREALREDLISGVEERVEGTL